jgi:PPM family protein phosphatase
MAALAAWAFESMKVRMQAVKWGDSLEYVALSDVGMRRANNQDAHAEVLAPDAEIWFRRGHLFVVCDGMGAHAAGELASKIAADGIPHTYLKLRDEPAADALRHSVEDVNAQIHSRGQANIDFQGMGTTASALLLLPQGAIAAHVGDSRVYRLRGKRLEQLTFDHSLVWEMSAAGQVPKDALPGFVPKNIITRSLGPHPDVQVDLEGPFPLEVGDTFLLCSDGLSGQVLDPEMGAILQCLPPAEAAQVMIDLANLRGGPDNSTVIIVRVTGKALTAEGGWQADPLSVGDSNVVKTVPKSGKKFWIAAGICMLAALGLGAAQLSIAAVAALVGGMLFGLIALLQNVGTTEKDVRYLAPGARLGRGPHVSVDCEPNGELAGGLVSMISQLRAAAVEERWAIDWNKFNLHVNQGQQALDKHDYKRAVLEYATALRFMMNELRNQRGRNNGSK